MIVRIREGELPRPWGEKAHPWRQVEIIDDDSVVVIDMVQALFGWNYGRVTRQGHNDWCGMSAASIVAFKSGDRCVRDATSDEIANVVAWLAR